MNITFTYLCENSFLLSFLISIICTVLIYSDNRYNKVNKSYISYIKIFIIFMIGLNGMKYIQNMTTKNIDNKYNNVKMGEPNF